MVIERENTVMLNDITYTLTELDRHLWAMLQNGTLRSKEDMHTAVLSTLDADGCPDARTVVVRKALPVERHIWCHTDLRANKVAQIRANPSVSWLFYDARRRTQIRLKGTATVHANDALTALQWEKTQLMSRRCYVTVAPPSSISPVPTSGLLPVLENRDPTPEEGELGRAHFGVIVTRVHSLEWLFLHHSGHRRARFVYNTEGVLEEAHWLVP